ncbi:MAG: hypothetical protein ABIG39_06935 [Candidatus Micrarchaeota archaeon]
MGKRVVNKDRWGQYLLVMICALFIMIIVMIMWSLSSNTGMAQGMEPRVASGTCRSAMKYHGILTFTIDESGSWFEREGKRCNVWTKGCLEYVKGGKYGNNTAVRRPRG